MSFGSVWQSKLTGMQITEVAVKKMRSDLFAKVVPMVQLKVN